MAQQVEKIPEHSIILFHFSGWIDPVAEIEPLLNAVVEFKHAVNSHVYRVLDFSQAKLDFGEMVQGMGIEINREGGSNDPAVTTYFVINDDIHKLGVMSIQQQDQYGKAPVQFFMSCDEAIAHAKAQTARTG